MNDPASYVAAPDSLSRRVILVTGASGGLGGVAARAFAEHGATVILHGRNTSKLEALYDDFCARQLPEPIILPLDFASATSREFEAVEHAIRASTGRLDGILHSVAQLDGLQELQYEPLESWLASLRVNVAAVHAMNRACLPLLRAAPDASVVLTGETHGLHPAAFWGVFAVGKSALSAYLTIQAQEWERLANLRINLLVPGKVDAPQRAKTHPGEAREARIPTARLIPYYLWLMGAASVGVSGRCFEVSA